MARSLVLTSLLVPDYDEAIDFFTRVLRWRLQQDLRMSAPGRSAALMPEPFRGEGTPVSDDKRWVVVAPGGSGGALLLARAATPEQRAAVGRQAGGRVGHFLHTDDFDGDRAHMLAHGVRFTEAPRNEAYGRVVVFVDPWGNRWDLIEAKPT